MSLCKCGKKAGPTGLCDDCFLNRDAHQGSLAQVPGSLRREIPDALREMAKDACAWVNFSATTFSLLYDLNRLPEQLEEGTREWGEMLLIVQHMRAAFNDGKESVENTKGREPRAEHE